MRTTLTLDDDVQAALKRKSAETGQPVKEIVNLYLRRGLFGLSAEQKPFVVKPFLALSQNYNYDNISELLDVLEGEDRTG